MVDFYKENNLKVCEILDSDNICFWNYSGVFQPLLKNYIKTKKNLSILKKLIGKKDYNSQFIIKNIVQNKYIEGEQVYMFHAEKDFKEYKNKLFSWLDKTDNQYFYILSPLYFYSTKVFERGYSLYKENNTGVNELNIEVVKDYALYKLGY